MSLREAIGASLRLLAPGDRRILALLAAAQMLTSLLDLAAVLLIGVVTVSAASLAVGEPSSVPSQVISTLGLDSLSPVSALAALGCLAALLMITKSLLSVFLTRRSLRFLAGRQTMVSARLATALYAQPILTIQKQPSQLLAFALTGGVGQVTIVILGQGVIALSEIALLVVLFCGLLVVDPATTLFATAFFAVVALALVLLLAGWANRVGRKAADCDIASMESVQETIATYRELSVANRRDFRVRDFERIRAAAASAQADSQFIGQIAKYVFEVALVVGALLLAASQMANGDLPTALGSIAVFLAAGSRIVPSLLRLQAALVTIRSAAGLGSRTFELADSLHVESPKEGGCITSDPVDAAALARIRADFVPSIAVEGVDFTYPGASSPTVSGVSLEVAPGTSLALVGGTGMGKTTVADLILGILQPDAGRVLLGDVVPSEAVVRWPGAISYVPQEIAMVRGTVRDNVALGLPRELVEDDLVWDALRRAQLAEFLQVHRDGLDTHVGEHGALFSGGQLQRLGIARALYSRPKLVLLDEATSALDATTEHAVAETLANLHGEVTFVIIAHRLATVRTCDQVAYLQGGTLVAVGSFEEVRSVVPEFDRQAHLLGL